MKNRTLLCGISILLILFLLVLPITVYGDAGNFAGDSDWGGFDDFDWGSTSDWDDNDDYYSAGTVFVSGGGSHGGGFGSVVVVLVIIVIVYILIQRSKKNQKKTHVNPMPRTRNVDQDSLRRLMREDPNFSSEKFTEDAANLYVRLQNAWQEKDLSPVRANLTDNLYAQYERQLQPYIDHAQTNHVERIAVLRTQLMQYRQDDVNDILTVELHTRITDYVTDDRTGEILRGSASKELFMGYEYTFIRTKGSKTEEVADKASVCPNCGAPLDLNHSGRCPYCDSVLSSAEYSWTLSAVTGLYQRSN